MIVPTSLRILLVAAFAVILVTYDTPCLPRRVLSAGDCSRVTDLMSLSRYMPYEIRIGPDALKEDPAQRTWRGCVRPVSYTYGLGYDQSEWVGAKWPGGVIPYWISPQGVDESVIRAAIEHFHTRTNIRFVPWTTEFPFLVIRNLGGEADFAPVGALSGPSGRLTVSVLPGSPLPEEIHEFGHVVGLFHEHTRHDRDNFIIVNYDNIMPNYQFDFDAPDYSVDIGNYDFLSIMHYSSNAFSANGGYTMTKRDGSLIGYNQGLSAGDIAAIEFLYPELGPSPVPAIPTPPPIPIVVQPPTPKPKPPVPKPPVRHKKPTSRHRHHAHNPTLKQHSPTVALQ